MKRPGRAARVWLGLVPVLVIVAAVLTTWGVSWWAQAIGAGNSDSYFKSEELVQGSVSLRLGVEATRTSVRRVWEPSDIAGSHSLWHGSGVPTWEAGWLEPYDNLPHANASFGWLGTTSNLEGVSPDGNALAARQAPVRLPGTRGEESAFGWPFLALSMGRYWDDSADQPGTPTVVYRGWYEPPSWVIDRLPRDWAVCWLPTQIVWPGFLANAILCATAYLAVVLLTHRGWRRLRSTRPTAASA